MVVSGNVEKYEELRASYNSVVDIGVPRAPPFEEYRGMRSICGNVFCMWVLCCVVCSCEHEQSEMATTRVLTDV